MRTRRKHTSLFALIILGVLLPASAALAGGQLANYQKVTKIEASSLNGAAANYAIVHFDADLTGGPACANGNHDAIAFDATTANGKWRLALFQAAMLSGRTVRVTGIGSCTSPVNTVEALSWAGFAD